MKTKEEIYQIEIVQEGNIERTIKFKNKDTDIIRQELNSFMKKVIIFHNDFIQITITKL